MFYLLIVLISFVLGQRFSTNTYSWGLNTYGQLGDDTFISSNSPKLSGGFGYRLISKIISSGIYHSLVLSESGQVYSFGSNLFGQLGIDNKTIESKTPVLIEPKFFGDVLIDKIAAGGNHSLVLTKFGKVFSFGSKIFSFLFFRK